jgi:hypothetical protein
MPTFLNLFETTAYTLVWPADNIDACDSFWMSLL